MSFTACANAVVNKIVAATGETATSETWFDETQNPSAESHAAATQVPPRKNVHQMCIRLTAFTVLSTRLPHRTSVGGGHEHNDLDTAYEYCDSRVCEVDPHARRHQETQQDMH
jgi:hypothetical protein